MNTHHINSDFVKGESPYVSDSIASGGNPDHEKSVPMERNHLQNSQQDYQLYQILDGKCKLKLKEISQNFHQY